MWLGIDFGTCYSSAAFILDGTLERVKDSRKLGYSFPSSVYVGEQGEILVGHAADYQRNKDPNRYRREFKRDLGRDIPYQLGDRHFLPEDLVAEVLRRLKSEADLMVKAHDRKPFAAAVITVPATYQEHKRRLMRQAAQNAGFTQVELLEEPVATAIYYAQRYNIQEGEIVLVYDLGGGTFDATLMQKQGAGYKLLTMPIGLEHCGGIDFDRLIYQDLKKHCGTTLAELLEPQRRDVEALRARLMVSDWCREVKHQLGEVTEFEDMLPGFFSEFYHLSRETFNGMIKRYIDETIQLCQQLIKDAGSGWEKLNRVLLVGGSCRIPYVQQTLEQELQRPVFRADEPELAICMGAALRGASLDAEKEADVYVSRGMARFVIADFQGAIENCDRALQINPNSARAFCSRGLARYKLGEYQDAIADYDQALQISSDLTFAYYSRGLARTETRDYRGAIEDFHRVGMIPSFEVVEGELKKESENNPEPKPLQLQKASSKPQLQNISLFQTLSGHSDWIRAIAVSSDGRTLVSGSDDKTIEIWDLHIGKPRFSLKGHSQAVYSVAICPGGQTLVSGGCDNTIKIWELNSGKLCHTITEHQACVTAVAISPDGQTLVSASQDNTIKIWELNTGKLRRVLSEHKNWVNAVAISLDGQTLISGSSDNTIKIWALNTGRLQRTLAAHTNPVRAVAISPDGQTIVGGSVDKTITVWKLKDTGGKLVWEHNCVELTYAITEHKDWVNAVAIAPDGEILISASKDASIKIWEINTGKLLFTLSQTAWVNAVAISSDGQTLISGGSDKTIKIWQMR